jgi:hypothetical protein
MKIFGYKIPGKTSMEPRVALFLGMKFRSRAVGWDLQGTKLLPEAAPKIMPPDRFIKLYS